MLQSKYLYSGPRSVPFPEEDRAKKRTYQQYRIIRNLSINGKESEESVSRSRDDSGLLEF